MELQKLFLSPSLILIERFDRPALRSSLGGNERERERESVCVRERERECVCKRE